MSQPLDLRKKAERQVVFVEKSVITPRSWKWESLKVLVAIGVVSVLGWGISNAGNIENMLPSLQDSASQHPAVSADATSS